MVTRAETRHDRNHLNLKTTNLENEDESSGAEAEVDCEKAQAKDDVEEAQDAADHADEETKDLDELTDHAGTGRVPTDTKSESNIDLAAHFDNDAELRIASPAKFTVFRDPVLTAAAVVPPTIIAGDFADFTVLRSPVPNTSAAPVASNVGSPSRRGKENRAGMHDCESSFTPHSGPGS